MFTAKEPVIEGQEWQFTSLLASFTARAVKSSKTVSCVHNLFRNTIYLILAIQFTHIHTQLRLHALCLQS